MPSPNVATSGVFIEDYFNILYTHWTLDRTAAITQTFFSKITIHEFALGDPILICSSPSSVGFTAEKSAPLSSHSTDELFIQPAVIAVCHGRVRILCEDPSGRKVVPVTTISEGEICGDEYLTDTPFQSYRAIACEPNVVVARIPLSAILELVKSNQHLNQCWHRQRQYRQRLLFFKHHTALHALSSKRLEYLANVIEEIKLDAGVQLETATPSQDGRYWLKQGTISSEKSHIQIAVGQSWGYPRSIPNDWHTNTSISVYKLPRKCWEQILVDIPSLDKGHLYHTHQLTSATLPHRFTQQTYELAAHTQSSSLSGKPSAISADSRADDITSNNSEPIESVEFPKPVKRRLLDYLSQYPFIEQQSSSDCGVACLAMVAKYWGKRIPIYSLRDKANVGLAGASLSSLAKAAEAIGLSTRPVRASLNRLAEEENPWIAHWEGIHYVVVYRVNTDSVIVADPASGRHKISLQDFSSKWTGYALLLNPTERLKGVDIEQVSLGKFLTIFAPHKHLILQILGASLLVQIFSLVSPLFTQIILDKVVVQKSFVTLQVFAFGLLMFGIWQVALTSVRQYMLSYLSNRLSLSLISGFINHALRLPLRFFETRRVGDIITRVQENNKIQDFLIQQVMLAWLELLTGFIYLALMLYYNWKLTILVVLSILPICLLTLAATPFLRKVSREIFNESADQNSSLVEMLTGVTTLKASAAETELRWRWEENLTREINADFKGQKLGITLQSISSSINTVASTLLLWYGATLVIQGELSIGQFVAFNMMIGHVASPVLSLANLWDELQEVTISVERLNDVFKAQPEDAIQRQLVDIPPISGSIRLDNVTFRYSDDDDRNTLQNISFEVLPGQTIALVGRSGSGKSTLVKLIQGLYHPTSGRIEIDGFDLTKVSPSSLRSQLGVVPQECFLFSGTISENIALFRPDYTTSEIVDVAKLAEAHTFISSMPLGYNTKVGERGSTLSGGQKQRLAIARALLGNPRILILDEATSSLDTESERRFQQNLVQIGKHRTTIVVAHRLSTVKNADVIIVLDRGVIAEKGSHSELIDQKGIYYGLAQQQLNL